MPAIESPQLDPVDNLLETPSSSSIETPISTFESGSEPAETRPESATADASPKRLKRAWYWRWVDNGPALLAILFLVTGALGLPLLYHSRAFSVRMKWLIAVANIVYTVLSCYWAYVEIVHYVAIIESAISSM